MALHRVTWVSQFTKRVNHHDAEELDVAQAHLAFLRARHPFIEYTLEAAPADAGAAEPVTGRTVLGSRSAERAGDQVTS